VHFFVHYLGLLNSLDLRAATSCFSRMHEQMCIYLYCTIKKEIVYTFVMSFQKLGPFANIHRSIKLKTDKCLRSVSSYDFFLYFLLKLFKFFNQETIYLIFKQLYNFPTCSHTNREMRKHKLFGYQNQNISFLLS
jgi:hypothetical protein